MKKIAFTTSLVVTVLSLAAPAAAQKPSPTRGVPRRAEPVEPADPAPATAPPPEVPEDDAPPPPPRSSRRSRHKERVAREPAADDGAQDEGDGPAEDGFSFGARVGYAVPMGTIAKDSGANDLSKRAAGMVPLWADAGYRINKHWYVGGYFALGIVSTSGELCKGTAASCSSSGTDLRFGAMARYTFKPDGKVSPWIGVSSGYEILNLSVTVGKDSGDYSMKGWEFGAAHVGADFHVASAFMLGPVVTASFGQYTSRSWSEPTTSGSSDFTNPSLHQWVSFGMRGQFDL